MNFLTKSKKGKVNFKMDTTYNFSGFQIICQIVCKLEKIYTAPNDLNMSFSAAAFWRRTCSRKRWYQENNMGVFIAPFPRAMALTTNYIYKQTPTIKITKSQKH